MFQFSHKKYPLFWVRETIPKFAFGVMLHSLVFWSLTVETFNNINNRLLLTLIETEHTSIQGK